MNAAIVYKWDRVVPGREAAGARLMADTNEFCAKAVAQGLIDDFAWYLGEIGFNLLILRGEDESLRALMGMPELQMLNLRSSMVNEGLQRGDFLTGDGIEPLMEAWSAAAEQLA